MGSDSFDTIFFAIDIDANDNIIAGGISYDQTLTANTNGHTYSGDGIQYVSDIKYFDTSYFVAVFSDSSLQQPLVIGSFHISSGIAFQSISDPYMGHFNNQTLNSLIVGYSASFFSQIYADWLDGFYITRFSLSSGGLQLVTTNKYIGPWYPMAGTFDDTNTFYYIAGKTDTYLSLTMSQISNSSPVYHLRTSIGLSTYSEYIVSIKHFVSGTSKLIYGCLGQTKFGIVIIDVTNGQSTTGTGVTGKYFLDSLEHSCFDIQPINQTYVVAMTQKYTATSVDQLIAYIDLTSNKITYVLLGLLSDSSNFIRDAKIVSLDKIIFAGGMLSIHGTADHYGVPVSVDRNLQNYYQVYYITMQAPEAVTNIEYYIFSGQQQFSIPSYLQTTCTDAQFSFQYQSTPALPTSVSQSNFVFTIDSSLIIEAKVYSVLFIQTVQNSISANQTFTISLINPCPMADIQPPIIRNQAYFINSTALHIPLLDFTSNYTSEQFTVEVNCEETIITSNRIQDQVYTLQQQQLSLPIVGWQEITGVCGSFTFTVYVDGVQKSSNNFMKYDSAANIISIYSKSTSDIGIHQFKIRGELSSYGLYQEIQFYVSIEGHNSAPPVYLTPIQTQFVLTSPEKINYQFPEIVDLDNDNFIIAVDFGMAKNFISYVHPYLTIKAQSIYTGNYLIKIILRDDNPLPLEQKYEITIAIMTQEKQDQPVSDNPKNSQEYSLNGVKINKNQLTSTLSANVKSISLKGELVIRFSEPLFELSDFTPIYKLNAIDFRYKSHSEIKTKISVNYTVISMQQNQMKFHLEFSDPDSVSMENQVIVTELKDAIDEKDTNQNSTDFDDSEILKSTRFQTMDIFQQFKYAFLQTIYTLAYQVITLQTKEKLGSNLLTVTFAFMIFSTPFIVPIDGSTTFFLELVNELMLLIVSYALIPLALNIFDQETSQMRNFLGWAVIYLVSFVILTNWIHLVICVAQDFRKSYIEYSKKQKTLMDLKNAKLASFGQLGHVDNKTNQRQLHRQHTIKRKRNNTKPVQIEAFKAQDCLDIDSLQTEEQDINEEAMGSIFKQDIPATTMPGLNSSPAPIQKQKTKKRDAAKAFQKIIKTKIMNNAFMLPKKKNKK
ncbi:UNKNOWN [Stylonychia lemnae]|uniref:Cadg domain containing protein n=1 Tax=Stylonychia lemnae TaxID=5949 RepID=A0A078AEJ4_STYLE|nr:UNKNOWN [Stylonychia lemnae]|eukprot:CDW79887.1 UNKNOWN [Stylonychia lemnae]